MDKVKYRVTLDLERPGVQHTIYAKRGDALTREVYITLRAGVNSYAIMPGTTAVLYATADEATIFSECDITANTISTELTTNVMNADNILLEFRLTDTTGAVLTTPQIKVVAEDTLYDEEAITAKDDFSALLNAITRAENAKISSITSDENVITITYNGGETVSFEIKTVKGDKGDTGSAGKDGADGSLWHFGTAISGDGDSIIYPMIEAKGGDFYFNNDTGGVYVALGSTADTASAWKYLGTMRGEDGEPGVDGLSPTVSVTSIEGGNRVTITDKDGVKSFDVLNGEATGDIPTKLSELENDSGFITIAVADLVNYYNKSQTLTKTEINALISAIPKFAISVVTSLPTANISSTTVYLVKSGTGSDLYTEYIYVNGAWELLGSQKVDLTGYATETWVNGKLEDYLTDAQLQSAINNALAQAKASGEFDGADGKDGYSIHYVNKTKPSANPDGYYEIPVDTRNCQTGDLILLADYNIYKVKYIEGGLALCELLFSIKGDKGDTGATGAQGIQGIPGDKGDKGDKGDTGASGSNGKDGTSVTVTNVSESTADGGNNVVTFSDGKTLTVKNGSKGSKGDKGDTGTAGTNGTNGKDGTSVTVTNVSTSTADGGSNVVTFSDGKTLTVKNGSKGSTGAAGKDGATAAQVIAAMATETWTFTLADGSTVTKVVPLV